MQERLLNTISFAENSERTRDFIDLLKVGVILYGKNAHVLYCNKAAQKILGLDEEELCSASVSKGRLNFMDIDGSLLPWESQPVHRVLSSGKPVSNLVAGYIKTNSDQKQWLLINADPLFGEDGHVKEVVCSFTDITEHKLVEEKLTSLYQNLEIRAFELACSNVDMERFVYVATHHLQEPLRSINSFLQLLKKRYEDRLDEQAAEYIQYAVEGSKRIKKLILDLLEYSKFTIDREGFSSVDMNKLLQEVTGTLSNYLEKNNVQLSIGNLPVVFADGALMQQLFMHLIRNAVKYKSDQPPVIKINSSNRDEKYIISVSDNGIGIDPDYSEKIFNLFQRLHQHEAYEGTGVGLAICEKIIRLHRGTIWVESEPGKGSTFHFTIPVKQTGHEKV